jgi:threonine synthase
MVSDSDIVSLGEGGTPVVWVDRWASAHGLRRVGLKLESINPTGSFKDRGTTLAVSLARAVGIGQVIEDSSGNAGASVAAYASRAGIRATIFVPAHAPAAKRSQMQRTGATIVSIEGHRALVTEAALAEAEQTGAYYIGHNANPFFEAGMATFLYELMEQLSGEQPAHLVLPTGGGSLLVGTYTGWLRWTEADRSERHEPPKFHAVQSAGCAPIVAALAQGLVEDVPAITRRATIAGGIEVERPPRARDMLAVLRATRGSAVAVSDDAIREERQRLGCLEGIDVEPTSAAALAGLVELARDGAIQPDETVIVAATGAGWKDPDEPRG